MAIAAVAQTISGKDRRRKKGPWDPSLRFGAVCRAGSVPGAGSADYTRWETGLEPEHATEWFATTNQLALGAWRSVWTRQEEKVALAAAVEDDAQQLICFARDSLPDRFGHFFPAATAYLVPVGASGRSSH